MYPQVVAPRRIVHVHCTALPCSGPAVQTAGQGQRQLPALSPESCPRHTSLGQWHFAHSGARAGMRLRYLEQGQGSEVVLLLHDLAESSLVWEPLAAFLDDMGYHVLAPDLRGDSDTQTQTQVHHADLCPQSILSETALNARRSRTSWVPGMRHVLQTASQQTCLEG